MFSGNVSVQLMLVEIFSKGLNGLIVVNPSEIFVEREIDASGSEGERRPG